MLGWTPDTFTTYGNLYGDSISEIMDLKRGPIEKSLNLESKIIQQQHWSEDKPRSLIYLYQLVWQWLVNMAQSFDFTHCINLNKPRCSLMQHVWTQSLMMIIVVVPMNH